MKRARSTYSETPEMQEMQDMLTQFPIQDSAEQKTIQTSLEQLEQDVTSIKSTLEQKKPKVTLVQLNNKLDVVIEILRSWSGSA